MKMDKRAIKDFFYSHCPDVFCLHKFLTKIKIASLRAKLISNEEVRAGESDFKTKQEIVEKYKAKWPKHMSLIDEMIEDMHRRAPDYRSRQDFDRIRTDMYFCYIGYGFLPDEYVFYFLENMSMEERRSFVSNTERIMAIFSMNDFSDMSVFNDKWKCYLALKDFYHRDAIRICTDSDYKSFESFVEKHPVFVKKHINFERGMGIELIDSASYSSAKELFAALRKMGTLILEEPIRQTEDMSIFNPESINTIRIVVMNTRHGIKVFPYSFLKNGRKGSFVDNGGAGGVLIGIDDKTGRLNSDGYDEDGIIYTCHPDSGVVYKGYQLPDWEQAHSICIEVAKFFPRVKYTSWDLAHTANGWIIVEGNRAGQLVAQQMTGQKGLKTEFNAWVSDIDLIV